VFVARPDSGGTADLVVLCRYACADPLVAQLRDTQWLSRLHSSNVPRTLALHAGPDDVLVTSEFVEGVTLAELLTAGAGAARTVPLDASLRILLDVLAGLQALHDMTDPRGAPLGLAHGNVTPAEIIVGTDGVTRIANVVRTTPRREHTHASYIAPEVLLGVGTVGPRSDLYSVGALLWEALSGRRLFDGQDAAAILSRRLTEQIPKPEVRKSWAAPLADIALRALDPKPDKRYESAARMAVAIVSVAGSNTLDAREIAELVEHRAGDRIRARRVDLTRRRAMPSSSDVRETDNTAIDENLDTARIEPRSNDPNDPLAEQSAELKTEVDFAFLRSMYLKGEAEAAPQASKPEPEPGSSSIDASVALKDLLRDPDADDADPTTVSRSPSQPEPGEDDEDRDSTTITRPADREESSEAERDDPTMSIDPRMPGVQLVDAPAARKLSDEEKEEQYASTLTAAHDLPLPGSPLPRAEQPIEEDPSDDSLTAKPSPAFVELLPKLREQEQMLARVSEDAHTMPHLGKAASVPRTVAVQANVDPRGETLPIDPSMLPPAALASSARMHAAPPAQPPMQPVGPPPNAPPFPSSNELPLVQPVVWGQQDMSQIAVPRSEPARGRWLVVLVSLLLAGTGAALIAWVLTEQPPAPRSVEPRAGTSPVESLSPPVLQRPAPSASTKKKR
jgi:serine/threonine protein kinase